MIIIRTFTGKKIDLEDIDMEQLDIRDIAHALSFICRGSGQCLVFYSVARHCIWCAKEALARGFSKEAALACLLHDASEAYMSDVPKPIKEAILAPYIECERRLLKAVYVHFLGRDLTEEEKSQVDLVDHLALSYDMHYLLHQEGSLPEVCTLPNYEEQSFEQVQTEYLQLFEMLSK